MLIDWFTVGAQALNFVILVALLKRFLYRPVLDAIDAREARIARQLGDAESAQAAAREEKGEFERRNQAFESQRDALLKRACDDAETERRRLMDAARQAADEARARQQLADGRDGERQRREFAERARAEVLAIARRVVADLAGATLEERIVAVFLQRLASLAATDLALLASGLDGARPLVVLRTAGELDEAGRTTLREAVTATLQRAWAKAATRPIDVLFEVEPGLSAGIEMVAGSRKVGWNVSHYLDSLEKVTFAVASTVERVDAKSPA